MLKSQTEFETAVFEKSAVILKRRKQRRKLTATACAVALMTTVGLHLDLPRDAHLVTDTNYADTHPETTASTSDVGVTGGTVEGFDFGIREDEITLSGRGENKEDKGAGLSPESGEENKTTYETSLALWITYDKTTQRLNLVGGTTTDLPQNGWLLQQSVNDSHNTGWKTLADDLTLTAENHIAVGELPNGCYALKNSGANYNAIFYVGLASEE